MSAAALLLVFMVGCTNSISPPASPADPVRVYLLDHGRHPSLLLPTDDGKLVRYVYGEWKWYALSDTGFFQTFRALLWPTQGALGRKELQSSAEIELLRQRDPFENMFEITVPRERARRLLNALDERYNRNISTHHFNADYDLNFVHDPRSYYLLQNCNHIMAAWLRDLGCEVKGTTIYSNWRIVADERTGGSHSQPALQGAANTAQAVETPP